MLFLSPDKNQIIRSQAAAYLGGLVGALLLLLLLLRPLEEELLLDDGL